MLTVSPGVVVASRFLLALPRGFWYKVALRLAGAGIIPGAAHYVPKVIQ
jgi:hypothetical protein